MDILSDQDPAGLARLAPMLRQLDADLVRLPAPTAAGAAVKAAWLQQQIDLSDAASDEVKLVAEELVAELVNQARHARREPPPRQLDPVRLLTLVLVLGGCVSVWGAIIASVATFI